MTDYKMTLAPDVEAKLTVCAEEAKGLTMREIRCPYCGFVITRVFSDVSGHYLARCRKCKHEFILNFAYFRRQKGFGKKRQRFRDDLNYR